MELLLRIDLDENLTGREVKALDEQAQLQEKTASLLIADIIREKFFDGPPVPVIRPKAKSDPSTSSPAPATPVQPKRKPSAA